MEQLTVLDTNLEALDILDVFTSLLWVERYSGYGDFEIFTPINLKSYILLEEDNYLSINGSDNLMIIEKRFVKSDAENGDQLVVKGRTLESILDRRVVWDQTIFNGDFQTSLLTLLLDNAIDAVDPLRNIPGLDIDVSSDPRILELNLEMQVTAKSLYETIKEVCDLVNLGFKIYLSPTNQFRFMFYYGDDHSYDQTANQVVVFSKKFDNIISSEYTRDKEFYKNVSLVLGAGEGYERKRVVSSSLSVVPSGLNRREMHTDARELAEDVDGIPIAPADYLAQLDHKGSEELAQNSIFESFEGEIDATGTFIYGRDFGLGDIIQVENEYGNSGKARVTEIIRSKSPEGDIMYPTFTTIE